MDDDGQKTQSQDSTQVDPSYTPAHRKCDFLMLTTLFSVQKMIKVLSFMKIEELEVTLTGQQMV